MLTAIAASPMRAADAATPAPTPSAPAAAPATPVVTAPVNLLANGDFTAADPADATRPAQWDLPDGLGVQWLDAPDGSGKAIRMDTAVTEQAMAARWKQVGITDFAIPKPSGDAIGSTYGLSLYSRAFPIEAKAAYRVTYEVLGSASGVKVWVRGYGMMRGEKRRLYEAVANGVGSGAGWHAVSHDFHPTDHTPAVTEMKVMLYAYWPAENYWFRKVRIEKLPDTVPAVPAATPGTSGAPPAP